MKYQFSTARKDANYCGICTAYATADEAELFGIDPKVVDKGGIVIACAGRNLPLHQSFTNEMMAELLAEVKAQIGE